jgi:hypothetical protein
MPNPAPLSTFEGTLRQVDVDALSPVARQVFDYAFPVFNEAPSLNPVARFMAKRSQKVETPFNYRRFAGGSELPRGSYATVCVDRAGNDNGTLVHELAYYAKPDKRGELYVFDGCDSRITGEDTRWLGTFSGYRPDPSSIVVAFLSRPNYPHPLLDPAANPLANRDACNTFRSSAPQSDRGVALLEVPTSLRHVRLERIFDLRRLSSQSWLNERARDAILCTAFLYTRPFEGLISQDLRSIVPKDYPWVSRYGPPNEKPTDKIPSGAGASKVLRLDQFDQGTFADLLPALVTPGRGGSPVTEAIGAMLRNARARGLVYPSARNDILCRFEGDNVVEQSGWCFVD